jgi:hypothetical protein
MPAAPEVSEKSFDEMLSPRLNLAHYDALSNLQHNLAEALV